MVNHLFTLNLKNMDVTIDAKKKTITLVLDFNEAGVASKSGKSKVHATTNGNAATTTQVNGKNLVIGVNAYTPA